MPRDSVFAMSRGLVLVIEDDEWISRLLQSAIREEGYEVMVCISARLGLETAIGQQPDCIVCDVQLPDHDGFWVARNVRTHQSRVSVTPFLFLSGLDDEHSRLEGFHVGADVYISKPFRVDEVVAQIHALVQMASRLRTRRDSMLSIPPSGVAPGSAIEGDLSQMSIATVLTVLEMERRTGTFEVVSKKRRAQLDIVAGHVTEGTVGGTKVPALTALRTMLAWNVGRFSFVPGEAKDAPAQPSGNSGLSLGAFLLEAMRLQDEAARSDLELPPSTNRRASVADARLSAPALGGPPSSPADLAPPSSRSPRVSQELSRLLDPELADWEIPAEISPGSPGPPSVRMARTPSHPAIPPPRPTPPPPEPSPVDRSPVPTLPRTAGVIVPKPAPSSGQRPPPLPPRPPLPRPPGTPPPIPRSPAVAMPPRPVTLGGDPQTPPARPAPPRPPPRPTPPADKKRD
jgi:DNA-binding response OmpR family regulator